MTRGYREDLAYVHDAGFGDFARRAAPELLAIFRRAEIDGGLVIDLGCGSGIWARELIRAGYDVLCVDQSAQMLKFARRRAPQARFVTGSFLNAKLPSCDAITAMGECVNYLLDPGNDSQSLRRFFARAYQALRPGGVLAFDFATPGRGGGAGRRQKNVHGRDWAILLETEEDPNTCVLTRSIVLFRRIGRTYRRSAETHRLRLYQARDLARMLRTLRFKVTVARGYGRFRFPTRGLSAIIARKPLA